MAAKTETKIVLSAEDKTYAAFASARKNLDGMTGGLTRFNGLLAGLGVGLSAAGMTAFVKTSIDAADAISKLAVKTGISVEQLTGWQHVMDLSGVSSEQFEMAVSKLNTTISKNPEKLEKIGVAAKDADGALLQMADSFQRIDDPTRRAAIAAEIFGERVGRDMVVALSQGRRGIEELIRTGQQLNPITTKMAQDAEQFNDALDTLRKRASTVGVTLANAMLPALNSVLSQMEEGIRIAGDFGSAMSLAARINPGPTPGENIRSLKQTIKEFEQVRDDLVRGAKVRSGVSNGRAYFFTNPEDVNREIDDLKKKVEFVKVLRAQALGLPSKTGLAREAARQKTEVQQLLAGQIDTSGYFDTGGKGKGKAAGKDKLDVLDPFYAQRTAAEKARAEDIRRFVEQQQEDVNDLQRAMAEDNRRAAEDYASALEGLVSNTAVAKTAELQKNVDILNKGFFDGAIGADQYEEAMAQLTASTEKLAEKAKDTNDIARELGLTFSSAFEDAVVGGKRFSEILRGLYQDLVRLSVRKTVTEPLAAGFSGLLANFKLPGFAVGTDYVPRDMVAVVHKGEAIIPARENKAGRGGVIINMTVVAQDAGSFRKSMGQIQSDLAFAVNGARRFA